MTQTAAEKLEDLKQARLLARAGTNAMKAGANQGEFVESIFAKGVSVSFLAKAFRVAPQTARERLSRCPPISDSVNFDGPKQQFRYDLAEAASYLITPKLTPEQFLQAVKRADLPPSFQQQFWDARLKQQRWEQEAGQLWRTEKVQEVLGTAFQQMKFTMQLWVDHLERETGLTDRQRELLIQLVDGLQQDIYDALVAQAEAKTTGSVLMEEKVETGPAQLEEDDVDDLI